jgi:hypothetical protein
VARPRTPSLAVDGGTPPPPPDRDEPVEQQQPGAPPVVQPPLVEELPDLWTSETIRTFVALPFMAAHLYARRRGPDDAWLPDESELDLMAGPLLNMANRYDMVRRLARFGDPVAFAAATGTYVTAESRRIALWRLEHEGPEPPAPDADLPAGVGVTEAAQPAPVRPWKPTTPPPE